MCHSWGTARGTQPGSRERPEQEARPRPVQDGPQLGEGCPCSCVPVTHMPMDVNMSKKGTRVWVGVSSLYYLCNLPRNLKLFLKKKKNPANDLPSACP